MSDHRSDFHDFAGVAYINCAFHGAMPRVATEAVDRALDLKRTPFLIRDMDHFDFPDAYRSAVAEIIGAEARDVAVTDSATQGTMILVSGLDWTPGDEVLIPRGEFPSNRFPWKSLETRGVVVREIDMSSTEAALEALEAAIGDRTRVVSLSWVSYSTGAKLDLEPIGALCREHGALLCVDGSQGVGGLSFDVDDTGVDLLMCAGYKWMLGPYGTGFAWVRPDLVEGLALANINWFSLTGARDFNRLSECDLVFEPGARRFDRNEPGNFLDMAGAAASARYLHGVGVARIERHNQALLDRLIDGLPAGFRSLAPAEPARRSNILCIAADSPERSDAAFERLAASNVYASRREGAIRFSPHVYNTEEQIDLALEALEGSGAKRSRRLLPRGAPVASAPPVDRPIRGPHAGRYVRLREVRPAADAADLYADSHRPETSEALWAYLHNGPFASESEMRSFLEEVAGTEDQVTLTVEHLASERAIGSASFMRIKPGMRVLELGSIWYLPEFQRTEANTETIYLMLREAFDRLGYRRVEWKCDALNTPSRLAAPRLGFRFEGIFRQHMIIKGHSRDTAWYSMIDREWPAIRANFERWLYADEAPRPSLAELNRLADMPTRP